MVSRGSFQPQACCDSVTGIRPVEGHQNGVVLEHSPYEEKPSELCLFGLGKSSSKDLVKRHVFYTDLNPLAPSAALLTKPTQ